MFYKIAIYLVIFNQFFSSKGFILNKESDFKNKNWLDKSKDAANNKLVSIYIDFADILRENEIKINKTISDKFDQVMNKLNKLSRFFSYWLKF